MSSIGFDDVICSFLFLLSVLLSQVVVGIYTPKAKVDRNELIVGKLKLSDLQNISTFYL